jgi:hypothetical protein
MDAYGSSANLLIEIAAVFVNAIARGMVMLVGKKQIRLTAGGSELKAASSFVKKFTYSIHDS